MLFPYSSLMRLGILDQTLHVFLTSSASYISSLVYYCTYEGWTFNFGNTPLDWIKELLE